MVLMRWSLWISTIALILAFIGVARDAEARIRCNGEYQVVRGQGEIATPYCQDEHIARVARSYGIRVSGSAVRRNPSKREEVCQAIGHDSRVYALCLKYRNDGCGRRNC